MPVLTIRLELIDNRVAFRPPLDQSTSAISVQELVHQWLDGYLARGKLVKMLGPKVSYELTNLCHSTLCMLNINYCSDLIFVIFVAVDFL